MLKDTNFKTLLMTNPERHDERDEEDPKPIAASAKTTGRLKVIRNKG